MAPEKWIRIPSPREQVHRACARMLRSRLEAVAHYLPPAAHQADEDVEHVHQLRVWTRRAEAALELCAELLSKRDRRELQATLDRLRTAAGDARDADVLRARIAGLKPCLARDHLLKEIQRRRRAAQQPIVQASQELQSGQQLLVQLESILAKFKKRRRKRRYQKRIDHWSRKRLRPLVKKFLKRGQADLSELTKLHKFRIAGKRLRYALELVGDVLPKPRRKRAYKQLDRLQTQLGSINDTANLIAEIERALAATPKRALQTQLRRLLSAERRTLAAAQQKWLEAWTDRRQARQVRERLKKLL